MNIRRVYAIFLRQIFLFRRSPGRIITVFYWSIVELFLWGFITSYLNSAGRAGFNFVTVILGAIILWEFFLRTQQGVSASFLEDIWTRNIQNLFATPLAASELLAGLVLTSVFQ